MGTGNGALGASTGATTAGRDVGPLAFPQAHDKNKIGVNRTQIARVKALCDLIERTVKPCWGTMPASI